MQKSNEHSRGHNRLPFRTQMYTLMSLGLIFLTSCATQTLSSSQTLPTPPPGLTEEGLRQFYNQFMDPTGVQNLINGLIGQIPNFSLSCSFSNPDRSNLVTIPGGLATRSNQVNLECKLDGKGVSLDILKTQPILIEKDAKSSEKNLKYTISFPNEGNFTININASLCQSNFTLPSGELLSMAENALCRTNTNAVTVVSDKTPPIVDFSASNINAEMNINADVIDGIGVGATKLVVDNISPDGQQTILAVTNGSTRFVFNPTPGVNTISGQACDAVGNCSPFTQNVLYQPVANVQTQFAQDGNNLKVALLVPDLNQNLVLDKSQATVQQERLLTGMLFPTDSQCTINGVQGQLISADCPLPRVGRKTQITMRFMDKAGNIITKVYPTELPAVPKAERVAIWGTIIAATVYSLYRAEKHLRIKSERERNNLLQSYIDQNDLEQAFDLVGRYEFPIALHVKLQHLIAMELVHEIVSNKHLDTDFDQARKLISYIKAYMTSYDTETVFNRLSDGLAMELDLGDLVRYARVSKSIPALKMISVLFAEDSTTDRFDKTEVKKRDFLVKELIDTMADEIKAPVQLLMNSRLDIDQPDWLNTQTQPEEILLSDMMKIIKGNKFAWFYKRLWEAIKQNPPNENAIILTEQLQLIKFFDGYMSGELFKGKNFHAYFGYRSERLYRYYQILISLGKYIQLYRIIEIAPDSSEKSRIVGELASKVLRSRNIVQAL